MRVSHAEITSMSHTSEEIPLTEDAAVNVRAGRTVLGFTLSQIIGGFVLVALATSAWLSIRDGLAAVVAEQVASKEYTAESVNRVSAEFTKALAEAEARNNERIKSARDLAEAERKLTNSQQERTNERIANVATTVESFRPIIALVPTLDQRTAAVERVGNNVQELALAVRTQQAVSEQLVETNKEIKASLTRLNDRLTNPAR